MPSTRHNVLPGFRLSLGYTLVYLSLLVMIPLGGLIVRSASVTWTEFWHIALSERAVATYRISFGCAFIAGCVNAFFGLVVAWVLVRYDFFGKKLIDAAVDLP